MAEALHVTVDDARVRALLRKAPEALHGGLLALVEAAGINIQRREREEAPVGVDGLLRRGVVYELNRSRMTATVKPTSKYAEDVEEGRGPHWVPVGDPNDPLRKWADFKGLNPWAVQGAIAKRGTKANDFVARTYKETRRPQEKFIERGILRLVGELNDGRI